MAINNAAKKAKKNTVKKPSPATHSDGVSQTEHGAKAAPLDGFQERAATLRLYVKDKRLLKEAKIAALEDDTSLSQLWEDWAMEWLQSRRQARP